MVPHLTYQFNHICRDFPSGLVVKNPPVNAGTGVGSLVREDPICCEAPKPVCRNYWAHALEPVLHNAHHNLEAHTLQLESRHSLPQLGKARAEQWRTGRVKNKQASKCLKAIICILDIIQLYIIIYHTFNYGLHKNTWFCAVYYCTHCKFIDTSYCKSYLQNLESEWFNVSSKIILIKCTSLLNRSRWNPDFW